MAVLLVSILQENSPSADGTSIRTRLYRNNKTGLYWQWYSPQFETTGPITPESSTFQRGGCNEEDVMVPAQVSNVDHVICHEMTRLVSCPLDELAQRLPVYSWAQVFAAVDRLSRQGTLRL